MRPPKGKGYAHRCETCDCLPDWRVERLGDALVSWACTEHLSDPCERFHRGDTTELIVKPAVIR